ncbi:MAG: beta strand repeat-containing protein [Gemmatimonadaceae bacterium]
MSLRTAVALALGCSTLVLAACGEDDEPTPPTRAFTMTVAPTTLSVQAGGAPSAIALSDAGGASANISAAGTGTLDVTVTRTGGFTGSVALTVEGLPAGVTASAATIAGSSATGTITITAAAAAAPGPTTITVRGAGEGVSPRTATVQLTITAAPGFTLALAPATLSVVAGQSGSSQANLTRGGGFTGAVNLTSSGAPAGITVAFTPVSVTGGSAAIAVNVAATVAAGSYPITIQGAGTGVTNQTATLTVTVTAPVTPTIALAVAPATVSIQQGGSGTSTLTLTRTNFTGDVGLTSTGAPAGMTVSFTPATLSGTTLTSTVNIAVGAAVAVGNHAITITGAGTGVTNVTATLTVTVTAPPASGIALAVAPAALSIAQGASGTSTLTLTRTNFILDVGLTTSGAPPGMTLTFNPIGFVGSISNSTVTVNVAATVAAGTYPITITGTGTGVTNATTTLTVTVTAAAGSIALTVAPTTLSVQAGASGTATATLTRTNFTGDVALTSTGAPTGVTVTFNPATLTGTTLTSTVTVAVGAAVQTGNLTITLQGAGTGVTNATTTLALTVTAATGSIALTTNPATLSVQQGQSGTTTLTIARTNFTGTVNLTSSGAPAGVTVTFNPASTTGTTSTVTVAVGAGAATGTSQITLTGAGTGVTNATVTLSLTVTASGGGSGNVTLTFCQQSGIPLWVGYSNNGGPWTQATGTNNVYSFTINTRGIVAYVLPSGNSTQLNVVYGTQAELNGRGTGLCLSTAATKSLTATVNGVNAGEFGSVTMSGGTGTVFGGIGSNVVPLNNVVDGPRDLIGVRSTAATFTPNSIVIQRDLNIPNNGSVTVDFATGVAPLARTATIANLGAQQVTFLSSFISKNFTTANVSIVQPSTSTTVNWFGVPDASTVSGDFHSQLAIATNVGSTSSFPSRAVLYFSRLATNQTLTLPDAITTPPTVTVAGTSPYVTINSNWNIQNPYNQFWTLNFNPSGSGPSATIQGSVGYFGTGPVTLNIPNFGAGFNAAHGLQAGTQLTWMFTATGGTGFGAGPTEGATQVFAIVGGTITP